MALTPFTSTVTATTLRANFDDATAALTTNATAGRKDQAHTLQVASLAVATALSLRSLSWTQYDDAEVRIFFCRVTDGAAAATVTATLTQTVGDTEFLLDNTVSLAVVAINGTVDSRTGGSGNYLVTTKTRFRLKKGVRYTLTMATTVATVDLAICGVQLRSIRRAA